MDDRFTDQQHLLTDQYHDSRKLEARIALHERFSTNQQGWRPWLYDQFLEEEGPDVVELGCGPGLLWRDFPIPEGWRLLLSDFSPGMLDRARRNLSSAGRSAEFALIDARSIPCDDAVFDVVIANHMLYHLPDRGRALSEIRRVLRPGGRLYASTNGPDHLRELEPFYRILDPRHVRMTEPFNLDNGEDQLAPYFATIERRLYPDGLAIDDVEPVIDYILSTAKMAAAKAPELELLRRELGRRLDDGPLRVTKSTGLFVATAR